MSGSAAKPKLQQSRGRVVWAGGSRSEAEGGGVGPPRGAAGKQGGSRGGGTPPLGQLYHLSISPVTLSLSLRQDSFDAKRNTEAANRNGEHDTDSVVEDAAPTGGFDEATTMRARRTQFVADTDAGVTMPLRQAPSLQGQQGEFISDSRTQQEPSARSSYAGEPPEGAAAAAAMTRKPGLLTRALSRLPSLAKDCPDPPAPPTQEEQFAKQADELLPGADPLQEKKSRSYYQELSFYAWFFPTLVSAALLLAGILLRVFNAGGGTIQGFGLWRWFFFFSGLFPAYVIGDNLVGVVLNICSRVFSRHHMAMWLILSLKRPLAHVVQAVLLLVLFLVVFNTTTTLGSTAYSAYHYITKGLACLILFTCVDVVKTLAAKFLSSHFNQNAHNKKLTLALKKESYLQMLATQRPKEVSTGEPKDKVEGGQEPQQQGFAHMMRRSTVGQAYRQQAGAANSAAQPANVHISGAWSLPAPDRKARVPQPLDIEAGGGVLKDSGPTLVKSFSASAVRTPSLLGQTRADVELTEPKLSAISEGNTPTGGLRTPRSSGQQHHAALEKPATDKEREKEKATEKEKEKEKAREEREREKREQEAAALRARKLAYFAKKARKGGLYVKYVDSLGHHSPSLEASGKDGGGQIDNEAKAKQLAFYIFWNVKGPKLRDHILVSDFHAFMTKEEAEDAFSLLDTDHNGELTRDELYKQVLAAFQERTNLREQLKDSKSVVGTLRWLLGLILHIIFIFFYLLIFNVDVTRTWVLFSSIFLGFSFIFGNTIKTTFESIIYIFIVHPFDVGDFIIVDSDRVRVDQIALTSIIVQRGDGMRLWVPVSKLSSNSLQNLTRSGNKSDSLKWLVDAATPARILEELAVQLEKHYNANTSEFAKAPKATFTGVADPMKVQLSVSFDLTHNGVDGGRTGPIDSAARQALKLQVSDWSQEN
ncbi:hypothetical protein WJX73_001744 [Symbiochloris irregularis]|uniref:EF-hand domain-containing protein n=1 Tax=Symbiochloris irregularis TaxID=706552 RepID=A0AAW1NZU8_9CHLO